MNIYSIVFLVLDSILLLFLARRWAPIPLLIGACYITRDQLIFIGSISFTVLRVLLLVGFIRVIIRAECFKLHMNRMDKLMLLWACWAIISSCFHNNPSEAIINRFGIIYDALGIYFLIRIFCQSIDDIINLSFLISIILLPVAIEMIYESFTINNLFSHLWGGIETPSIRMGRVRASGPFAHAILAGTVGAVCIPLMVGIWQRHRKAAITGIISCATIIICSVSSGPILSAIAGIGALLAWRYQPTMRFILPVVVIGYVAIDLVTSDPAYYYILSRLDITGGSTGWHRAALIKSAIEHLPEWWLIGTDYTRHWMPTGVSWSLKHTDITNQYIQQGVYGGLPLMFLFIAILYIGFYFVGKRVEQVDDLGTESRFMFWTLGSCLFTHVVTFISVSYFDQSSMFIYLTLAAIASAYSSTIIAPLGAGDLESPQG
jgi:hypothetical protein